MNNLKNSFKLGLSLVCIGVLLSACGGGSSSGNNNNPTETKKTNTEKIDEKENQKYGKKDTKKPQKTLKMDTSSPEFLGTLATGQTLSFDDGDDGDLQRGYKRSFTKKDGIVIDNVTGIQWQDSFPGGNTNNKNCDELKLGGYSDWRMPNSYEKLTITLLNEDAYPFDDFEGRDGIFTNLKTRCVR